MRQIFCWNPISISFVVVNFILRIVLFCISGECTIIEMLSSIMVGILSDVVVLIYLSPFVILTSYLASKRKNAVIIWHFKWFFFCIFTAIAEFLFWQEFESRFNFIAVDYLIYTREVIGNIAESYNIPIILLVTAVVSICIAKLLPLPIYSRFKWMSFNAAIALMCLVFWGFDSSMLEFSENRYANEISKNGLYEFFSACWHNDLPFERFYITGNQDVLTKSLRHDIQSDEKNSSFLRGDGIARYIKSHSQEKKLNVVLIMVESLTAEFLEHFGNRANLTPNIDRLFDRSMLFTNIIATGTRTVYGLAAVNLSIPPIPGNSIIRRKNNENLSTIGSILRDHGYICKFVYGGYGYFDNMNYFFENNGYDVIDRFKIDEKNITFSNAWGICDEDLFEVVLKEADESLEAKKPFFLMVMTTSNHRPYTYPDGKIDIPSKTGRTGGVKYTDFAIGKFIDAAMRRKWFDDTVFIITADHTAGSAGKITLDPTRYHIPLLIYSPKHVRPRQIHTLASQIDIGPTLLAILNMSYRSQFFGHDILSTSFGRAFISNYQQVGYLTDSDLCILKPIKHSEIYTRNGNIFEKKTGSKDAALLGKALQYFQSATNWRQWNKRNNITER
ncbi:MAG: LTA synthase family protein [Holosporales bacterium]|jgi:phosphoglycerol transferase MdoB-like AlkP superfamily enzyme|nr:LTA synthase family protein [Holosporales bacterium]